MGRFSGAHWLVLFCDVGWSSEYSGLVFRSTLSWFGLGLRCELLILRGTLDWFYDARWVRFQGRAAWFSGARWVTFVVRGGLIFRCTLGWFCGAKWVGFQMR